MKKIILTCAILFAAISSSFAYNNCGALPAVVYGPGGSSAVIDINAATTIHLVCSMTGGTAGVDGECIFRASDLYWDVPLMGPYDLEEQDFTGGFSSLTIDYYLFYAGTSGIAYVLW